MSFDYSKFNNMSGILCSEDETALLQDEEVKDLMNLVGGENLLGHEHVDYVVEPDDFKPVFHDINEIPHNLIIPPKEPQVLSNEEYSGPFTFEVCIVPNSTKNPWEYSVDLNKIFIDMGNSIPVDFSLENRPETVPLFVRATPTFSQPQYSQELVFRCINHEHPKDPSNKNIPENVYPHVIRCLNQNAVYLGNKSNNERLSVVIPLAVPQTGTKSVREMFQFVCKSSCPGGMNRRPIDVIFTLEDMTGKILGRRVVCVRICSCPKRDKEKEERDEYDKSKTVPRGKKRKVNNNSDKKLALPNAVDKEFTCTVVGKKNLLVVLKIIKSLMADELLTNENRNNANFRKCYNDATSLLNKMNE